MAGWSCVVQDSSSSTPVFENFFQCLHDFLETLRKAALRTRGERNGENGEMFLLVDEWCMFWESNGCSVCNVMYSIVYYSTVQYSTA